MNKRILLMFLFAISLLASCQTDKDKLPSEMDPKDLPEGRAFEDEFTKGLLQSTEEVLPGYYPFLAKNERWEMAFPEDGLTNVADYKSKDNFELVVFTDWEEKKSTSSTANIKYHRDYKPGNVESKQKSLRENTGYSLEFEQVEGNDQTYYIAPFEREMEEGENELIYGYAAYIQKESDAGGIFVKYTVYCKANCEETKEAELKKAHDWIMTIQFLDQPARGS